MTFDIFELDRRVAEEYRDYVTSFVRVREPRLRAFVEDELGKGRLWPEPILELNPAFERGKSLGELAREGVIRPETARFFGERLVLMRHQEEAIRLALSGRSVVVSTGTGSGKSLTYLVPIVDAAFRAGIERPGVVGLCIYPMNALVGSQLEALRAFKKKNWPDCPLRFERYTGQDRDTELRNALLGNPHHVILTNYVMLELALLRPTDRTLVERMVRNLAVLAVDELHVHRGRQGADVAMLLRRLRERIEHEPVCIGTSATIASEGDGEARKRTIARVGSRLFGVEIGPEQVVGESLVRRCRVDPPGDGGALRAAIEAPPPEPEAEALARHPLAAWVESRFGVTRRGERIERARPLAFDEGVRELARESGLPVERCAAALRAVLQAGARTALEGTGPFFAFRLHRFFSSGASFYATLEPAERRHLQAEPAHRLPGEPLRLLAPLAFCRSCGQDFHLVVRTAEGFLPRSPELNAPAEEMAGEPGFLVAAEADFWDPEEEGWPDDWLEWQNGRERPRREYKAYRPERLYVTPDGRASREPREGALAVLWQKRPFMICPCCRTSYNLRVKRDFGKLVTLSQIGRSTASTVLAAATVRGLRALADGEGAAKLLSFTDNRQDAALQTGHTNDFVRTVTIRSGLVRALEVRGTLRVAELGRAIFEALALPPTAWMKTPVESGPGFERARRVMQRVLAHLALTDLARSWRVTQPNLEDCGLLALDWEGLAELSADDGHWRGVPVLEEVRPKLREKVVRALLDHLRRALAIRTEDLDPEKLRELARESRDELGPGWAIEEDQPVGWRIAFLPGSRPRRRAEGFALGARSTFGRYLRLQRELWSDFPPQAELVERVVLATVEKLRGHFLVPAGEDGIQLQAGALLWRKGDGRVPPADAVRTAGRIAATAAREREPNAYFTRIYREGPERVSGLSAAEHTGQVSSENRLARERAFREGGLALLCCSPTMELGIDIRDLSAVHLRNLPPDPARYAQRAGRAGRGGQPALVLAFASWGSAHDRHFFARRERMVAGAVTPPLYALDNEELLESHLHAVWLAETGVGLGGSVREVLDLDDPALPLQPSIREAVALPERRQGALVARMLRLLGEALGRPTSEEDRRRIERLVAGAPARFDRAFDRWRELYRAAVRAREEARRVIDRPTTPRVERQDAERREREARRDLELLRNETEEASLSDYYPYRYLAAEGFIPGYNFPRLPVRLLVPVGDRSEQIDRPRFLGLAEFGPGNLLYHEGQQYRVSGLVLPSAGLEQALKRGKRCPTCARLHLGEEFDRELCAGCGRRLDGGAELWLDLLEQNVARARPVLRITCEEDERAREGYDLATAWRSTVPLPEARRFVDAAGAPLCELHPVPRAELWRVNLGWRRGRDRDLLGFRIDPSFGRWAQRESPNGEETDPGRRVLPAVFDVRNLIRLRPLGLEGADDAALLTLAYALRRGVQRRFELEEHEVAVELVGEGAEASILLWEAAEGGLGLVERLAEPAILRELARATLELLHVDPETGAERAEAASRCEAACYDCLLSYGNQRDHPRLDRRLVLPWLRRLAELREPDEREARKARFDELSRQLDPASSFERAVLEAIFEAGLPLPDRAQFCPAADLPVQVDFFWKRDPAPGLCLFVDGPAHRDPDLAARDRALRRELERRGFVLFVVASEASLAERIGELGKLLAELGIQGP
ncbi:MAG: DEAD/DEAH box helicase [Geminicoccaceae bacterium]